MLPIHKSIGFQLAHVCRANRNAVATMLSPFGLYPGQDLILEQLAIEEGLTQSQLAERVGIEVSTMTKALQRLERYGLIERHHDCADTRIWRVCLTAEGRALHAELTLEWQHMELRLLANFSAEECAQLSGFLARLEDNIV